jgi:uncharacterized protein
MILVDAGPLVALFDRHDSAHSECRAKLRSVTEGLATTLPVLTEAFYLLSTDGEDADALRAFLMKGGATIHRPTDAEIERSFELMERYRDLPMDFADASIVAAAETLRARQVFTLDARHFGVYRARRGHRHYPLEVL